MSEESIRDLALQIRTELADTSPQGFHFSDQVLRQDAALERLIERLTQHGEDPAVAGALTLALREEKDGWTSLKLLELVDRLTVTSAAPALIELAGQKADDDRAKFLSGRACEILLKLPLNRETRARADEVCKRPLEEVARFRLGATRERALHRPRVIEWLLLVILMLMAIVGVAVVWLSLKA